MRIVLTIHHEPEPDSGAPGTTLALADAYRAAGHDVQVLSYADLPASWPAKLKNVAFPWLLPKLLRRLPHPVDVVDASTGDTWVWGWLRWSQRAHSPVLVVRSHGLEHVEHEALMREVKRGAQSLSWRYRLYGGGYRLREVAASMRMADAVFMLNDEDAEYAADPLGVAGSRISIRRNGLPSYLTGQPEPEASPLTRIAFMGSYIPRKGTAVAAAAFADLLRRYHTLSVTYLGVGVNPAVVLRDFPVDLHERIRVVSKYAHVDLPQLLAGHQLLVFPSLSEAFGKAVADAMACGLTVVAADTRGPRQIVRPGTGLLVSPGDAAPVVEAVEHLLSEPAELTRMRRAAHREVQTMSWTVESQARLEVYAKLLRARHS